MYIILFPAGVTFTGQIKCGTGHELRFEEGYIRLVLYQNGQSPDYGSQAEIRIVH
jgi:hypothetical protein